MSGYTGPMPYAAMDYGEDNGRDAAHDGDHGIGALRDVLNETDRSDAVSLAWCFGFVAGLSEVWEAIELVDFLPAEAS